MKKTTKIIISVVAVLAVICILFGVYKALSPKAQTGSKAVKVEVTDNNGQTKSYDVKTDAEFLSQVMDELSAAGDFSYEGTNGDYGLYITAINGVTADYDADGAYWSIMVNGEYGMYGADSQPVADGDTFGFVYEVYAAQ
ncbi:MAG: DUF4430 domain-containing protein [Lachnospiraceae bacterium]|nr:DUF4430 domain-containing protein [Lachnospiraceae bacterium]